jgi:exopolyphosphatase/guanosine-5'-triphosphate,3'-diphosphate pyrophosphatase
VRRACIDIGSNTTRLLVADCDGERLSEVHQRRDFTRIGRHTRGGEIAAAKFAEIIDVVTGQVAVARELGAVEIRGVATAAIRGADNGPALLEAIRERCGLETAVLTGEEEARLAFVGAARTLGHVPDGELGVVDVGGGSSELVVGIAPGSVSWSRSFALGSGDLADEFLGSDPPSQSELDRARGKIAGALASVRVPRPVEAVAVGGSAASLFRLAGPVLDPDAFTRALRVLASERAITIARQFALEVERVRLLPAGLLILQAASELFGASLQVGRGGIREAVLLEAAG